MPFASLGLAPALARAAAERGYAAPTAIQTAAIPVVLRGGDLLAEAPTGSGKTAAFALPLLQRWSGAPRAVPRRPRVLVLVPTRELAVQVGETFRALALHLVPVPKVSTLFGGVSVNPQMMALRGGADVVVATPGRLLDLVARNALDLAHVATLVLDEADRLLDAGFADELARVLALLPSRRQNLLFSATLPPAVQALAQTLLQAPAHVQGTAEATTQPAIEEHAVQVDEGRRTQLLRHLVQQGAWDRALVFVATQHGAEHVAQKLRTASISAAALHGDLSQGRRTQVLADLKNGLLRVVVATDLAARGIDIALLPVVVNYDLPRAADDYTHRIGRTGRAGATGLAVSFVTAAGEAHFRLIEKRQGRRVAREVIAGFEPVDAAPLPPDASGGVKGTRKSKKDKAREALRQR